MSPLAWLPQSPKAVVSWAGVSPRRRPAATAAPKGPQSAVGWKPRRWNAPGQARPTAAITSTPATIAASTSPPEAWRASPAARAAVTQQDPVWTMAPSSVSS
jgi:hypothetical protein